MRTLAALLAALALTVLTACSSGPDHPEHEQAYLDALYADAQEAGSGIQGMGDTDVLDLGYAICDDLAAGMDPTEVVASLQPAGEDTPISKVASPLVGHADAYLCDTEG